jgi:AcrR family transcriptional regulator
MREKGYAGTSLTDVALAAQMSPSHIRYYFDGKDAILEHYFEAHCRHIVADIRAIPTDDPADWFDRYCAYFIRNPHIRSVALGVIVEIFGLSVHQSRLREIKVAYDREMLAVLTDFFERVGVVKDTPAQAASVAQAVEVGLKFHAAFAQTYAAAAIGHAFVSVVESLIGRPIADLAGGADRSGGEP